MWSSVTFCDDAEIRGLNAQWRGKDSATNVLSFPTPGATENKPLLGDIIIAYETVVREAQEQDKTLHAHVTHMIMHGFLHLIGYDHESAAEAEEMETLERDYRLNQDNFGENSLHLISVALSFIQRGVNDNTTHCNPSQHSAID